ncbi:F0F1 ATP synthase subunit epsilon [Methylotuvimicrobium alcaliphilum]|uniref:ATP synthase epsilon chain n=1 Tax=Methylotuvimicrobium alcaliphilum (strain DSM 19304 / NCIMB 14124 / VKM B-2133 / 20Z) TaxID=1091494 RepID=G4SY83_META2|nr:F0F1 ATP synthase subunit epsilon [Methylotuvimicrobium alcaliphilum]CCE25392.1 H+-transporting two-sector ATPase, delta/epsilon subunit [Methylotuvimicrobium alcaliphilum 20Z]
MKPSSMHLKILLPFRVFAEHEDVSRIVAETSQGSFGILPNRLDCAAALAPGILTYETASADEVYLAIDQGVLVKIGSEVLVSVRNAIGGIELDRLREAVEHEFLELDEHEKNVRSVMAKLESGFVRRFMEYHRG